MVSDALSIAAAEDGRVEFYFETPSGEQAQVIFLRSLSSSPTSRACGGPSGYSRCRLASLPDLSELRPALGSADAATLSDGSVHGDWQGVERTLLDRVLTAVICEDQDRLVIRNRALADLARHCGLQQRACQSYGPKSKGNVGQTFCYIGEDFLLGGSFCNLKDRLRHRLSGFTVPPNSTAQS